MFHSYLDKLNCVCLHDRLYCRSFRIFTLHGCFRAICSGDKGTARCSMFGPAWPARRPASSRLTRSSPRQQLPYSSYSFSVNHLPMLFSITVLCAAFQHSRPGSVLHLPVFRSSSAEMGIRVMWAVASTLPWLVLSAESNLGHHLFWQQP